VYYQRVIFFLSIVFSFIFTFQYFQPEENFEIYLDNSMPYVGTNYPRDLGFSGEGIRIAIIDTGVDYTHPDLLGFGPEGKVIGGYDFVDNDEVPIDTNGHGTEVAGIIAAEGQLKGIAPKAKILAYRVSDNGESVSSDLIIKAIEQAIVDKADIINISLGVNRTNQKIDDVVNKAVKEGILVVTAAGNNGPALRTIGSPGINPNTITVGATYNNITASLVATLDIDGEQFQVLPMVGTNALTGPITGEILFGKFGREADLQEIDARDSILLVERGSDIEGEIVYFSDKEKNAANSGAKAVLVYNNKPGMFFGELIHEFAGPNYLPTIPVLSLSDKDGLKIRELLQNKTVGRLNIFYNPDFVAHFSSRGPVSPFYIKPDLVAPGAFINTTLTDGKYNFTSGTSFAAPHVTGAAALLLQKNSNLQPNEIKSILTTTTDLVTDPYGNEFPMEASGSGRLNVTKAFKANLIINPTYLAFNLSPDKKMQTQYLEIRPIEERAEEFRISFKGNNSVSFNHKFENGKLAVTGTLNENTFGTFEDRLIIETDSNRYNIPILIHISEGAIFVDEQDGKLSFQIAHPDWSYAKISIINKASGKSDTTSATPTKNAYLKVFEAGEYWIEAKVRTSKNTFDIFDTIKIMSIMPKDGFESFDFLNVPIKPFVLVLAVVATITLIGIKLRR
jgi:minor extracellular serine protease Vpr